MRNKCLLCSSTRGSNILRPGGPACERRQERNSRILTSDRGVRNLMSKTSRKRCAVNLPRQPCTTSITLATIFPSEADRARRPARLYSTTRKWATFAKLHAQADLGCDLCTLVRQYLTNFVSYKKLCGSQDEIELHHGADHLGLECPAFGDSLNIPLLGEQEFNAWRCTQTPQRRQVIIYEQASE